MPVKVALGAMALVLAMLGVGAGLSWLKARRLGHQRSELLEEVGVLQSALLPEVPARIANLWVSAAYRPAEGPTAGGNFYDVFALDGERAGVVVGEVSGPGRARLADSTLARHTIRHYLKSGSGPAEALRLAAPRLVEDLSGELRCAIAAVYDPRAGTLTHASSGAAPDVLRWDPDQPAAGSGRGAATHGEGGTEATIELPPGARACLFTSGLAEARLDGRMIGPEGIEDAASELGDDLTAEALLDAVVERARSIPNDLVACVVEADEPVVAADASHAAGSLGSAPAPGVSVRV